MRSIARRPEKRPEQPTRCVLTCRVTALLRTPNQGSGSEDQTVGGSAAHPVQNQASTGARDGLLPQAAEILVLRRMFGWRTHGLRGSTDPPGRFQRHSGRGAFDQPDSVLSGRRLAEPRHPTRPGRRLTHCRASRPGLQSFDLQVGGRLLRSSRGEDLRWRSRAIGPRTHKAPARGVLHAAVHGPTYWPQQEKRWTRSQ